MSKFEPPIQLEKPENAKSVEYILSMPPPIQVVSLATATQQTISEIIETPREYSEVNMNIRANLITYK